MQLAAGFAASKQVSASKKIYEFAQGSVVIRGVFVFSEPAIRSAGKPRFCRDAAPSLAPGC